MAFASFYSRLLKPFVSCKSVAGETVRCFVLGESPMMKSLEEKMMQRTARFSAIAAITWLLSVAILISAAHFNVAQAKNNPKKGRAAALVCGKEVIKQCSGVPVRANNMLECLQKSQEKLSARCVALAKNVVRRCDRDAAQHCQAVAAGQGNILGCLTTAKRLVSSRCNAALDAAFLSQ